MKHRESYDIPKHRKDAVVWTNRAELRARLRKTPRCPRCRKHQFRTKTDARGFLAIVIGNPMRERQWDDFQRQPYECPYGNGWHIGHDRRLVKLLESKNQ